MGKHSGIDYVTASWGPWYGGCTPRGPECARCYAKREMRRYGKDPEVLTRGKTTFYKPLHWQEHQRIFVCPWSDFFLEGADPWREEAWDVIRRTPQHAYIIPTKRPERTTACLPPDWGDGWPNAWLLLSAGCQASLDRWLPTFLTVPAVVHGLSAEPLLERIDLRHVQTDMVEIDAVTGDHGVYRPLTDRSDYKLDWVATGCESGPDRRHTEIAWVEDLITACNAADVPIFVKQLDFGQGIVKMPEVLGRVWDQYPKRYDLG